MYRPTTASNALTTGSYLESIFEFKEVNGNIIYLSSGNLNIYSGTNTLKLETIKSSGANPSTDLSPQPTFTGSRWQWAALPEGTGPDANSYAFAAQIGNPLLVWRRKGVADPHTGDFILQKSMFFLLFIFKYTPKVPFGDSK